jgi:urease alpha subunit
MFGARARVAGDGGGTAIAFVSGMSVNNAIKERLGLGKEVEAIVGTRNIGMSLLLSYCLSSTIPKRLESIK